jgi:hypothetical protein
MDSKSEREEKEDEGEWENILPSRRWALVCGVALDGGFTVTATGRDLTDVDGFGPMGRRVTGSGSRRCGVVPRTAPSLRVERMRRVRWWASRTFAVSGGEGRIDMTIRRIKRV